VISRLVEIVSKGGNYLLNIGPKGDGSIPDESVRILREVGAWMEIHSSSIYGTTASPLNEQPWGVCTAKDSLLYLHVLIWPDDNKLEVRGLRNTPSQAYLLANENSLELEKVDNLVTIHVPDKPLDPYNTVIALQVLGMPESVPPVVLAEENDTTILGYKTGVTSGKATKRYNRKGKFFISKWSSPEDEISWNLQLDKPAEFSLGIVYSAPAEGTGREITIEAAKHSITHVIQPTGKAFDYMEFDAGKLEFSDPGNYLVKIRPSQTSEGDLLYFHSLKLIPEGQ
jgi:alpha-L-fucosidase